jgi:hypothetical protein
VQFGGCRESACLGLARSEGRKRKGQSGLWPRVWLIE